MKRYFLFALLLSALSLSAQIYDPIKWSFEHNKLSDSAGEIVLKATIDEGWHLYGTQLPEDGPIATSFVFEQLQDIALDGELVVPDGLVRQYDPNFAMELNWYEKEAVFVQKVKYTGDAPALSGYVNFMACNDETCLPPDEVPFSFGELKNAAVAETTTEGLVDEMAPSVAVTNDLWTPVIDELNAFGNEGTTGERSLWWIFLAGLIGGLVALFTPCVWPIIPMTVSFFLKRSGNKSRGKRDAVLYGISIIVIYLALGLLITLIFGASALNSLSTNAFFNLFFFALLVLFAVSFFGAFEITLPASWTTKIDAKAETTGGILSILLMAFTLALVSFSCTGPIIGTLLVEVAGSGSILAPAIGMLGFAIALAIPFSLFAFFPTMLKSLPKSGGWLNSVKVVLAFLELALSLKFLSVADLAYGWHILDREVFVALWIVIFASLGFYLLGKLRFPHDDEIQTVSVPRYFMATISLAFAVYMVPGLWGAPLKAVSAFAPPLYTQDFNLYDEEVHAQFDNYEAGMAYAATTGKPVVVDFSGFGCVNCRKMEAAVWTDPEVKQMLTQDFVLITLFVDDKTPLAEPYEVEENGRVRKIKTIGDKWSYLQRSKFGANAQPFYVMLNAEGKPLNSSYAFDENPAHFIEWLNVGKK
ncbi:MAG: thioredoxin family protein [Bacteroidetes bacterium]|uniref:Thioredoxin family protein n=1 Tax=Candidatus Gallipaludibacter merdavium TaxID=2840839 RepID=A0A9D9HVR1_9BACT|nr:thioredoxin family protein [Candidatus Gallipaludibacter merdavium]